MIGLRPRPGPIDADRIDTASLELRSPTTHRVRGRVTHTRDLIVRDTVRRQQQAAPAPPCDAATCSTAPCAPTRRVAHASPSTEQQQEPACRHHNQPRYFSDGPLVLLGCDDKVRAAQLDILPISIISLKQIQIFDPLALSECDLSRQPILVFTYTSHDRRRSLGVGYQTAGTSLETRQARVFQPAFHALIMRSSAQEKCAKHFADSRERFTFCNRHWRRCSYVPRATEPGHHDEFAEVHGCRHASA